MKAILTSALLVISLIQALAQDTTLVLNTGMFSPGQIISLATLPGWVYQPGPAPNGADSTLSTVGWQKRKPSDLSVNDATKMGRVEGWFRLRLRLDSSFNGLPVAFLKGNRAAADLYVNGQWLASFGQTGLHQKPYAEYTTIRAYPTLVKLVPGQNYLIALHIVDEVSPFSAHQLKADFNQGNLRLLHLVGPQFIQSFPEKATTETIFATLWLVVTLLLTLLFGLLSLLNLYEKQLIRTLALWAICQAVANVLPFLLLFPLSYRSAFIGVYVGNIFLGSSIPLLIIALVRILGFASSWLFNGMLIGLSLLAITLDVLLGWAWATVLAMSLQALLFLYVLSLSWKKLKGGQWAVVTGALMTIAFFLLFIFIPQLPSSASYYGLTTGLVLSLPVSLLVYIVLRFSEIVAEVQEKARAVLQVTEEKRHLLASQNERLEQQVGARTAELNQSLTDLKSTQAQLVQKEKLASLGELTAGIAHEIQNPLNFVNNFAEVSTELVSELKQEEINPERDAELISELLDDLTQNLQKITHHGGRASAIVKGMLEHSRTETGEKRLTDLNALADDYLNIAYQGLRAKDNSFTAELKTNFGTELGLTEVVPQEIGRVLLNLYNNAFYAVQQKQKTASADYQPTVMVSTTRVNGQVEIRVGDNGTGIAESVKAKIFHPFFTTKPTGEGTGLGLSLAHDIITKGHQGSLIVYSQEGEGTQFVLQLPTLN